MVYFLLCLILFCLVAFSLGCYYFCLSYLLELEKDEIPSEFRYSGILEASLDFLFILRLLSGAWSGAGERFIYYANRARVCLILAFLFQIVLILTLGKVDIS